MIKFKKGKVYDVRGIIIASVISVVIGTFFLWTGTQTIHVSAARYLWNIGYSLNLGLALFMNGHAFSWIERKFISWVQKPTRSLTIAISFHLVYSTFVIFFTNWLWFIILMKIPFQHFMTYGWFIIIGEYIVLIIITAILYAKSFFREWRVQLTESEALKQEAISLQYQIMQNQVNPHFLFNSLNTLGSLIDIDAEKAKQFTRELSQFYRELLHFKDKELVPISEEINFVKKYIYLQKIRFGNNFDVEIRLKENLEGEVIPMSIQMMVENAVKHNKISKENPLRISIESLNDCEISVSNNYQPKENNDGSNKIGLKNLTHRYLFLTNKEMRIEQNEQSFSVIFPIVKIES